MRKFFLLCVGAFGLALFFLSLPVMAADMIHKGDGFSVRLMQAECAIPPLALVFLANGAVSQPKAAAIVIGTQEMRGCWAIDADNDVMVGDDLGRGGFLPMTSFKPVEGV
jgi:hypothetical protein